MNTLDRLQTIENDSLTIEAETTSGDAGWDFLTHVTRIVPVKRTFGVLLTASAVATLGSVGNLVDPTEVHLAKGPGVR